MGLFPLLLWHNHHTELVLGIFNKLNNEEEEEANIKLNKFRINKSFSRKEVFQPHLPVRLPCYDLAPVIDFTLGDSLRLSTSGTLNFHGLTGGVYKARERIHRSIADLRLLANPAS